MIPALFVALALFASSLAQSAAPVPPLAANIPSVTSCNAPCYVFFDASATTDADLAGTLPFHLIDYRWSFGDTSAGNWAYGANTAISRNGASGAVAAHVYNSPATYTWNLQVSDGTTTVLRSGQIVVSDWAADGTTACVNANSADFTGCPSGATHINQAGTGSWPTAVAYITAGTSCGGVICKRVLLHGGDVYTGTASATVNNIAGPTMIGSYGTGKAIVRTTTSTANALMLRIQGTTTDFRLDNLEFDGQSVGNVFALEGSGSINKILLQRLYIHHLAGGFEQPLSLVTVALPLSIAFVDSVVQNIQAATNYHHGILTAGGKTAIMGNLFDTSIVNSEHLLRLQLVQLGVVSNNTVRNGPVSKEMLSLRGPCTELGCSPLGTLSGDQLATKFVVVADNLVKNNQGVASIMLTQVNAADTTLIHDVVIERNWIVGENAQEYQSGWGIITHGNYITVRNNLVDLSLFTSSRFCHSVDGATAGMAASDNVRILNNTCYSSAVPNDTGIALASGVTNVTAINNLAYTPAAGGSVIVTDLGAVAPVLTPNSTTAQMRATSPSFDGPLSAPKGFRPATSGYGVDGGTVSFPATSSDFFNCANNAGKKRMGAFEPFAQAQCSGVAGP